MARLHDRQDRREIALDLPPEARSVTRARQWAIDMASAWQIAAPTVERLALVVTELASNAVVHARSPFRIRLSHREGVIFGSVSDTDPEPPVPRRPPPRATAGRGLMLVRRLTERSGVSVTPQGKSVWFELDELGSASARPSS